MKLFLAGSESQLPQYRQIIGAFPYILMSFFTLRNAKNRDVCLNLLKRASIGILDSGAYSLRCGAGKDKKQNFEEYVKDYIDMVKTYRIKNYVELDLDNIYPLEVTNSIRLEMEKAIGWAAIPCWHIERGFDELSRLSEQYDYIAIGGIRPKQRAAILGEVEKFYRRRGEWPKIHLMGVDEPKYFNSIFYSCDSSGAIYGVIKRTFLSFAGGSYQYSKCFNSTHQLALKYSLKNKLRAVKFYDR